MNTTLLIAGSATFVALSWLDLEGTLKNLKRGAVEDNPLLGKRPSPKKLTIFAVTSTALWLGLVVYFFTAGTALPDTDPNKSFVVNGSLFVLALGNALRLWVIFKHRKTSKELDK